MHIFTFLAAFPQNRYLLTKIDYHSYRLTSHNEFTIQVVFTKTVCIYHI